jgi:sulfur carrier protein
VNIILNGEPYTVAEGDQDQEAHSNPEPFTIAALLARLGVDPRRVAVERNFVVIKRRAYEDTRIGEGDQIEIVNFVGGGQGIE